MKHLIYLSVLLFVLIFSSCAQDELILEKVEHKFFLENNDAILPVLVKGNSSSKVFVIMLHGGPGDSGVNDFGNSGIFQDLELEYAMVYFDQRCAGLSQGNCDPSSLEVSDFVEDIDKLIITLEHRYGTELSFFLLGHSWGATLGLDYLINGSNKSKIKGYIHSDGSHNIPKLFVEQKDIMIFYANQQIDLGNNIEEWQSILNEILEADPLVEADRIKILTNTYKTENLFQSVDSLAIQANSISISIGNYFSGIFPVTINGSTSNEFTLKLFEYDITNQLSEIRTPIAMYWGKLDLIHPPSMALDIFGNIGSAEKELYFFPKSFHSPMASEGSQYQSKVKSFIQAYK